MMVTVDVVTVLCFQTVNEFHRYDVYGVHEIPYYCVQTTTITSGDMNRGPLHSNSTISKK